MGNNVYGIPRVVSESNKAKSFISLDNNARNIIKKDHKIITATVFKFITKYLIQLHKDNSNDENYNLYNILKFLKIYSVLYSSIFFYKSDDENPFYKFYKDGNKSIDNILKISMNDIDTSIKSSLVEILEIILKDEKVIGKFANYAKKYGEFNPKKEKEMTDEVEDEDEDKDNSSSGDTLVDEINNILLYNINYFNIIIQLTQYFKQSNRNSFDKMICEYNYSDKFIHDYIIEIDKNNYDKFKENINGDRYKDSFLLLSVLIDDIFKNHNEKLEKPFNVESIVYYYTLTDGQNKMSFSHLNFIKQNTSNTYEFIKDNIREFDFDWIDKNNNKKTFRFTENGIIEVI